MKFPFLGPGDPPSPTICPRAISQPHGPLPSCRPQVTPETGPGAFPEDHPANELEDDVTEFLEKYLDGKIYDDAEVQDGLYDELRACLTEDLENKFLTKLHKELQEELKSNAQGDPNAKPEPTSPSELDDYVVIRAPCSTSAPELGAQDTLPLLPKSTYVPPPPNPRPAQSRLERTPSEIFKLSKAWYALPKRRDSKAAKSKLKKQPAGNPSAEAEEMVRQAKYETQRERIRRLVEENKRLEERKKEQKKKEEEMEVKRVGVEKMREDLRGVGMQPAGFVVDGNGVVEGSVFLVVGEVVEGEDGSKELFVDLENNEAM